MSLAGSGFWPARSVQSQHDGRFRWPEIPAGVYELRVSKGPLVAPPLEGLILDAGARRAFGIVLAQGWSLAGRVVDARTGSAIAGAEVTVASGALGMHTRHAKTDSHGEFALGGVVGSEQSVYVEADGYILAGPLSQAAESPSMDVRLERAARITGEVVDERGRPIAGAWVRAFGERSAAAPPPITDSLGITVGPVPPITAADTGLTAFVGQSTTASDGTFELRNLRPGPYTVAASHEDFAPGASDGFRLNGGAIRSDVRIVMRRGAELAGRVVDERGGGLEAIPVELRAPDERLPRMSVTEPDGSFSFRGVRGEVTVTALPYDLPHLRRTVVMGSEGVITIELALSTSLYTMRGRVVDERGFGVGGALVTVTSTDPKIPLERSAKSAADGSFSVPALPEPPFKLEAEHPAFSPARLARVGGIDDVRVVMTAGVTFLGEVIDDWTGDSLRNVRVAIRGPLDDETQTRADGSFVFRQLPTGTYDVTLSHTDYETQRRRVVIEPPRYVDRPQELERVRMTPGGIVEGDVVDANDEPVTGAEVSWGDPPRWDRAAVTNARGRFQLRGVPAGSVWITARHAVAGENWTSDAVQVRPLETTPGAFIRLPDATAK